MNFLIILISRNIINLHKFVKQNSTNLLKGDQWKRRFYMFFSGDNIKIESISPYYDINTYKLHTDDDVITFYDFKYNIVNKNSLN